MAENDTADGRITAEAGLAATAEDLELLLEATFAAGRRRIVLQRTALGLDPRL